VNGCNPFFASLNRALAVTTSNAETFDEHLSALGVRKGMRVVIHSSLISFGRIDGGAETVYDSVRRTIGNEGTVAVPTYTFHIGPTDIFDPATTPSRGFGAFSEWVRMASEARRGTCPIHGYAAIGPDAELVSEADETKSFGPGSAFDAMHQAGFSLLLLGCSFQQGATFVHHVESNVGVPYREWLKLPRQIRQSDGGIHKIQVDYYARMNGTPWQPHLHDLQEEMMRKDLTVSVAAPYGTSHLMQLDTLYKTTKAMLSENPLAMVINDPA
jgi:aminoglycoside 3-N-acetyltransferase